MTKPVLYDFFATWCGPCRMQTPIIEELAKELDGAVEIKKVDVDENIALAQKYGIQVVPTLIIESDGKVVQRLEGVTDGATLKNLLRPLVG